MLGRGKMFLVLSFLAVTVDGLCFGGGGGGCGCGRRKKREIDYPSESSNPFCNSPHLQGVMERNMAYSASESRISLSRTLETEGDRFLIVCYEEKDGINRSMPLISAHYGMEYCMARRNGHKCHAFAIMNLWS